MSPPIYNDDFIPKECRDSFGTLTERIDKLVEVSILKPLSGGYSESVPFLVYANYEHTGAHQVFKVGEKGIIDAEAKNWDNFVENSPFEALNIIHKKKHIPGSPHSLIVYNFAGRPDVEPITFEHLYEMDKNPEDTLKHLFMNVLKPLSNKIRKGQSNPQIKQILEIDPENIKEITEEVNRLFGCNDVRAMPKIRINETVLFNPLHFYPFTDSLLPESRAIPVPKGIVHGDLNAKNILFYNTEALIKEGIESKSIKVAIPCIIDYAHTKENLLYTDITKLESVLKFQLLKIDSIKPDMLLQFEDKNILCGIVPSNHPLMTDPHLQKLFVCIKVLREIASKIISDEYEPLGYWLLLYKNTLLHLKYVDLSDSQKRYAFISASIILSRHLVE